MDVYAAVIDICGYLGEVLLNGAPLVRSTEGVKVTTIPVNQWVVAGENVLEIRLTAEVPFADPDETAAGRRLDIGLVVGTEQQIFGDDELPRLVNAPPLPVPTPDWPLTLRAVHVIAASVPRWRWQDAELIRLDQATTTELLQYAAAMHQAAQDRNVAWFLERAAAVFDEVPGSFGASPAEARREFEKLLRRTFARPSFAIEPFQSQDVVFSLACNNRLAALRTKRDEPIVRARGFREHGGWGMPFWLGKYQGQWMQLR